MIVESKQQRAVIPERRKTNELRPKTAPDCYLEKIFHHGYKGESQKETSGLPELKTYVWKHREPRVAGGHRVW